MELTLTCVLTQLFIFALQTEAGSLFDQLYGNRNARDGRSSYYNQGNYAPSISFFRNSAIKNEFNNMHNLQRPKITRPHHTTNEANIQNVLKEIEENRNNQPLIEINPQHDIGHLSNIHQVLADADKESAQEFIQKHKTASNNIKTILNDHQNLQHNITHSSNIHQVLADHEKESAEVFIQKHKNVSNNLKSILSDQHRRDKRSGEEFIDSQHSPNEPDYISSMEELHSTNTPYEDYYNLRETHKMEHKVPFSPKQRATVQTPYFQVENIRNTEFFTHEPLNTNKLQPGGNVVNEFHNNHYNTHINNGNDVQATSSTQNVHTSGRNNFDRISTKQEQLKQFFVKQQLPHVEPDKILQSDHSNQDVIQNDYLRHGNYNEDSVQQNKHKKQSKNEWEFATNKEQDEHKTNSAFTQEIISSPDKGTKILSLAAKQEEQHQTKLQSTKQKQLKESNESYKFNQPLAGLTVGKEFTTPSNTHQQNRESEIDIPLHTIRNKPEKPYQYNVNRFSQNQTYESKDNLTDHQQLHLVNTHNQNQINKDHTIINTSESHESYEDGWNTEGNYYGDYNYSSEGYEDISTSEETNIQTTQEAHVSVQNTLIKEEEETNYTEMPLIERPSNLFPQVIPTQFTMPNKGEEFKGTDKTAHLTHDISSKYFAHEDKPELADQLGETSLQDYQTTIQTPQEITTKITEYEDLSLRVNLEQSQKYAQSDEQKTIQPVEKILKGKNILQYSTIDNLQLNHVTMQSQKELNKFPIQEQTTSQLEDQIKKTKISMHPRDDQEFEYTNQEVTEGQANQIKHLVHPQILLNTPESKQKPMKAETKTNLNLSQPAKIESREKSKEKQSKVILKHIDEIGPTVQLSNSPLYISIANDPAQTKDELKAEGLQAELTKTNTESIEYTSQHDVSLCESEEIKNKQVTAKSEETRNIIKPENKENTEESNKEQMKFHSKPIESSAHIDDTSKKITEDTKEKHMATKVKQNPILLSPEDEQSTEESKQKKTKGEIEQILDPSQQNVLYFFNSSSSNESKNETTQPDLNTILTTLINEGSTEGKKEQTGISAEPNFDKHMYINSSSLKKPNDEKKITPEKEKPILRKPEEKNSEESKQELAKNKTKQIENSQLLDDINLFKSFSNQKAKAEQSTEGSMHEQTDVISEQNTSDLDDTSVFNSFLAEKAKDNSETAQVKEIPISVISNDEQINTGSKQERVNSKLEQMKESEQSRVISSFTEIATNNQEITQTEQTRLLIRPKNKKRIDELNQYQTKVQIGNPDCVEDEHKIEESKQKRAKPNTKQTRNLERPRHIQRTEEIKQNITSLYFDISQYDVQSNNTEMIKKPNQQASNIQIKEIHNTMVPEIASRIIEKSEEQITSHTIQSNIADKLSDKQNPEQEKYQTEHTEYLTQPTNTEKIDIQNQVQTEDQAVKTENTALLTHTQNTYKRNQGDIEDEAVHAEYPQKVDAQNTYKQRQKQIRDKTVQNKNIVQLAYAQTTDKQNKEDTKNQTVPSEYSLTVDTQEIDKQRQEPQRDQTVQNKNPFQLTYAQKTDKHDEEDTEDQTTPSEYPLIVNTQATDRQRLDQKRDQTVQNENSGHLTNAQKMDKRNQEIVEDVTVLSEYHLAVDTQVTDRQLREHIKKPKVHNENPFQLTYVQKTDKQNGVETEDKTVPPEHFVTVDTQETGRQRQEETTDQTVQNENLCQLAYAQTTDKQNEEDTEDQTVPPKHFVTVDTQETGRQRQEETTDQTVQNENLCQLAYAQTTDKQNEEDTEDQTVPPKHFVTVDTQETGRQRQEETTDQTVHNENLCQLAYAQTTNKQNEEDTEDQAVSADHFVTVDTQETGRQRQEQTTDQTVQNENLGQLAYAQTTDKQNEEDTEDQTVPPKHFVTIDTQETGRQRQEETTDQTVHNENLCQLAYAQTTNKQNEEDTEDQAVSADHFVTVDTQETGRQRQEQTTDQTVQNENLGQLAYAQTTDKQKEEVTEDQAVSPDHFVTFDTQETGRQRQERTIDQTVQNENPILSTYTQKIDKQNQANVEEVTVPSEYHLIVDTQETDRQRRKQIRVQREQTENIVQKFVSQKNEDKSKEKMKPQSMQSKISSQIIDTQKTVKENQEKMKDQRVQTEKPAHPAEMHQNEDRDKEQTRAQTENRPTSEQGQQFITEEPKQVNTQVHASHIDESKQIQQEPTTLSDGGTSINSQKLDTTADTSDTKESCTEEAKLNTTPVPKENERRGRYDLSQINSNKGEIYRAINSDIRLKTLMIDEGADHGRCYCSCDLNSKPVFFETDEKRIKH